MKFTITLPYTRRGRYSDSPRQRPYLHNAYTVVSEVVGESVTVSFEQEVCKADGNRVDFGHLAHHPRAITVKNADAVLELVAGVLGEGKMLDEYTLPVVETLLAAKGWGSDRANYDMLDGQEGWGFMGGTGCGQLVHKLLFTKVLGVNPELTGVRRTLAAMQFNGWLGQVKAIRNESKHLRDAVTEDQLFVTYNAHPICQASVHYHSARGFLVSAATEATCSCSKCAAKLGIKTADRKAVAAIKTPDAVEYKGFRLTYSETTKAGPKSQTTGKSKTLNCTGIRIEALDGSALPTTKTLNAELVERGQKLAHTDDPRGVKGLWYVEAVKNVTGIEDGNAVFLKCGRIKDEMMAAAKLVIDSNMLLAKP
jgi:hypothetical protein